MLGSNFDLDREIARIASKRDLKDLGPQPRESQTERIQAFSAFDRSLNDFLRSVGDGAEPRDDAPAHGTREPITLPRATRRRD